MSRKRPFRVLILCTGNSARSIVGEYLLREKGKGRFEVHSAGAKPSGKVNPFSVWVLKEHYGIDARDARSKSWDEFKNVDLDFVITVCDNARESCPIWPGKPILAHWGSPDPAAVVGTEDEKKRAFVQVAAQIAQRVDALCALPDERLLPASVQKIGEAFGIDDDGGMTR